MQGTSAEHVEQTQCEHDKKNTGWRKNGDVRGGEVVDIEDVEGNVFTELIEERGAGAGAGGAGTGGAVR